MCKANESRLRRESVSGEVEDRVLFFCGADEHLQSMVAVQPLFHLSSSVMSVMHVYYLLC